MKIAPLSHQSSGKDICSSKGLSGQDYKDDVVLHNEDTSELEVFFYRLGDCVIVCGAFCISEV